MGSDETTRQCPRCGGGRTGDAPMCQWCGLVDPDSPLGQHQAKVSKRRELWVLLAIGAVLLVIGVVFITSTIDGSRDKARDDSCEILYDPERCD